MYVIKKKKKRILTLFMDLGRHWQFRVAKFVTMVARFVRK
jgi:hypothetical protein